MTKETKIGLLVGLSFIILFAIILSKKGPSTSRSTSALTLADAGISDTAAKPTTARPLDRAGKVAVERLLPTPISSDNNPPVGSVGMIEEPVGRPIPDEDQPIEPLPASVVSRLNLPVIETEVPIDTEDVDDESAALASSVVSALNGDSSAGDSGAALGSARHDAGSASIDMGRSNESIRSSRVPSAANSSLTSNADSGVNTARGDTPRNELAAAAPAKPIRIIAVHEVQAGESLGKIAAKHYGRATPARIDAIFNANRDQLESVNAVKVATKLNIPLLEGEYANMFEPVAGTAPPPIQGGRTGNPVMDRSITGSGQPSSRRDDAVRIPPPIIDRGESNGSSRTSGMPTPGIDSRQAPSNPGETSKPASVVAPFVWYEVREKDTLSKIAKHQLGNEKLYREIYRMNQDILPDQHKLKPGLKIRLPMPADKPPVTSSSVTTRMAGDSLSGD
ncbi:MAG: LysM peptidoglycan-binding domain-containing protein [Phycisphaerae bacterium]|nr:LysM peptidoglycan-binding domain-containing protein [Phycisphaerae bacterium]